MKTQPFADDDYHYRVPKNHAAQRAVTVLLLLACAVALVVFVLQRSPPLPSRLKSLIGAPAMTRADVPARPAGEWVLTRDRSPLRVAATKTESEAPLASASGLMAARELATTTSQRPVRPRANMNPRRAARVTAAASETNVEEHVGRPGK